MSRAAAGVLAAVFLWAATAKLVRRPDMTALGLPSWTATAVAAVEVVLAVALVGAPVAGGIAALALLAGFTTFLVRRVGTGTGCGCFGGAAAKPVSSQDLVRNALLLVLAGVAAFA